MGLFARQIHFSEPAPDIETIAAKITEITGLEVSVEPDPLKEDFHAFSAEIAFREFPDESINVYAYVPGSIRKFEKEMHEFEIQSPIKTEGYDDVDGVQHVYLRAYLPQEPTLVAVTELALNRLGGSSAMRDEDVAEFGRRLTVDELRARHEEFQRNLRRQQPKMFLYGAFMILMIPVWLVWTILKLPYTIWKLRKISAQVEKEFEEQLLKKEKG